MLRQKGTVSKSISAFSWLRQLAGNAYTHDRKRNLKHNYGLSLAVVETMFEGQKGLCAICNKTLNLYNGERATRACVDHNHNSGKVRGLLCFGRNVFLGMVEKAPMRLTEVQEYLIKYEGAKCAYKS